MACGSSSPDQGLNMGPLHWEHGVLATGSPGKSLPWCPRLDYFISSSPLPTPLLLVVTWRCHQTWQCLQEFVQKLHSTPTPSSTWVSTMPLRGICLFPERHCVSTWVAGSSIPHLPLKLAHRSRSTKFCDL